MARMAKMTIMYILLDFCYSTKNLYSLHAEPAHFHVDHRGHRLRQLLLRPIRRNVQSTSIRITPTSGHMRTQYSTSHRNTIKRTQLSTFSRCYHTTRKPVEARVRDRVHGVVARYRFQTEATELAVVRLPPQHKNTRHGAIINTSNSTQKSIIHVASKCDVYISDSALRNSLLLQRSLARYTTKPTCIARNPSTGT